MVTHQNGLPTSLNSSERDDISPNLYEESIYQQKLLKNYDPWASHPPTINWSKKLYACSWKESMNHCLKTALMDSDQNDHVIQHSGLYVSGQEPNGLSISTFRDTSITSTMTNSWNCYRRKLRTLNFCISSAICSKRDMSKIGNTTGRIVVHHKAGLSPPFLPTSTSMSLMNSWNRKSKNSTREKCVGGHRNGSERHPQSDTSREG